MLRRKIVTLSGRGFVLLTICLFYRNIYEQSQFFWDYLLVMSLRIKSYKLVGREYLRKLVSDLNDNCECNFCTSCKYIKEIKEELLLNDFETHNKTVKCWRIDHTYGNIAVRPEINDETD